MPIRSPLTFVSVSTQDRDSMRWHEADPVAPGQLSTQNPQLGSVSGRVGLHPHQRGSERPWPHPPGVYPTTQWKLWPEDAQPEAMKEPGCALPPRFQQPTPPQRSWQGNHRAPQSFHLQHPATAAMTPEPSVPSLQLPSDKNGFTCVRASPLDR